MKKILAQTAFLRFRFSGKETEPRRNIDVYPSTGTFSVGNGTFISMGDKGAEHQLIKVYNYIEKNTSVRTLRLENCSAQTLSHTPASITKDIEDVLNRLKNKESIEKVQLECFDFTDLHTNTIVLKFLHSLPSLRKISIETCELSDFFKDSVNELMNAPLQYKMGERYDCVREDIPALTL